MFESLSRLLQRHTNEVRIERNEYRHRLTETICFFGKPILCVNGNIAVTELSIDRIMMWAKSNSW